MLEAFWAENRGAGSGMEGDGAGQEAMQWGGGQGQATGASE